MRSLIGLDQTGAVIAATAAYATVRELVADVCTEGIEATVRESSEAGYRIKNGQGISGRAQS